MVLLPTIMYDLPEFDRNLAFNSENFSRRRFFKQSSDIGKFFVDLDQSVQNKEKLLLQPNDMVPHS